MLMQTYRLSFFPFPSGYFDFVQACRKFSMNVSETRLSHEILAVLTHYYFAKIVQAVFICKYCFPYLDLLMKFLIYAVTQCNLKSVRTGCNEENLVELDLDGDNSLLNCTSPPDILYHGDRCIDIAPFR